MKLKIVHPGKLCLFFLLSLIDLFLTWRLLLHGHGQVYEGNPIAEWWLSCYGWAGLAAFKIATALAVGVLTTAISLVRPRTGGRILVFACTAVLIVVAYSCQVSSARGMPVSDLTAEELCVLWYSQE
jgi:hypothetical protein